MSEHFDPPRQSGYQAEPAGFQREPEYSGLSAGAARALLRAAVVSGAAAVAVFVPIAWYWKIVLFAGILFVAAILPLLRKHRRASMGSL